MPFRLLHAYSGLASTNLTTESGALGQPIGEPVAMETIEAALDAGFVDYDTAPHYGLGLSEQRMGKGLKVHAKERPYRVWTKVRLCADVTQL